MAKRLKQGQDCHCLWHCACFSNKNNLIMIANVNLDFKESKARSSWVSAALRFTKYHENGTLLPIRFRRQG